MSYLAAIREELLRQQDDQEANADEGTATLHLVIVDSGTVVIKGTLDLNGLAAAIDAENAKIAALAKAAADQLAQEQADALKIREDHGRAARVKMRQRIEDSMTKRPTLPPLAEPAAPAAIEPPIDPEQAAQAMAEVWEAVKATEHDWEPIGEDGNDLLRVYCARCRIPLVPSPAPVGWRRTDWRKVRAEIPCGHIAPPTPQPKES